MLAKFRQKIEDKKDSRNIFWKMVIGSRNIFWKFYFFSPLIRTRKKVFETIYKKNIWIHGSGPGSFPENTIEYRVFLQKFLADFAIKSVVDVGCGDWQFSRFIDWSGITYTGIDIVASVIEKNNTLYKKENIRFYHGDIVTYQPPKADLLILKDVLQHLSNKNILTILKKTKEYKYVLIINDYTEHNSDCFNGGYRPLNINNKPFNLHAQEVFSFDEIKKVFLLKN